MKDKFDREIKVGDHLVYPYRRGSSTEMRFGRVVGFGNHSCSWSKGTAQHAYLWNGYSKVTLYRSERAVIVNDVPEEAKWAVWS